MAPRIVQRPEGDKGHFRTETCDPNPEWRPRRDSGFRFQVSGFPLSSRPMKPFRTPLAWVLREYADRQSMRRLRERRLAARRAKGLPEIPPSKITDNSEPWLENPRTVDDFIYIAEQVNALVEKWGPRSANS